MYEDGIVSATGHWQPYLDIVQHGPLHTILHGLIRHHFKGLWASDLLGGSESEGTHCLLGDLEARTLYLAPLDQARTFLKPALPDSYRLPTAAEQATWWTQIQADFEARRHAEVEARKGKRMEFCFACVGGYVRAEDWGYDECPACGGNPVRWVEVQPGDVPTLEIWEDLTLPDALLTNEEDPSCP